jgi:hypothetical protein
MRPWSIVAAVIAGLAIVILLAYGADGRDVPGRAKEAADERAAQDLVDLPIAVGPEQTITVVLERNIVPPDTAALLGEVRDLLAAAESQPPEQEKATLEQAVDKLDAASDSIDEAAEETSPSRLFTRIRLERINRTLDRVQAVIEDRLALL